MATQAALTSAPETIRVTPQNFARAETDLYFSGFENEGALRSFVHNREPTPIDEQKIVRMNRDTLYSSALFDLDAGPVTITLPDSGERFMSLQIVDEDQYTHGVFYEGSVTLARQDIGTRYVAALVRVLVDPSTPGDKEKVHQLQDAIVIDQPGGPGRFEIPEWDRSSQDKVRKALLQLGETLTDFSNSFGTKDEVDPIAFLIGSAAGWGGNPRKEATYLGAFPEMNDGQTAYEMKVKDVPVDGFWSLSVYNSDGYFEKNDRDAYSVNNLTAQKDSDGSVTVQFGGDPAKAANFLPIMPGWNYVVRLYRPRKEILDGTWKFPDARPIS